MSSLPDTEAVALLAKSVKRWNEWKSVRPGAIDLEGADLSERKLAGADLTGVNLKEADLRGADLSGANLQNAVLYKVNAEGARFARCCLDEVYAADACFEGADLTQVRATRANFSRSVLRGARLDHAKLLEVTLDDADLTEARLVGALLVATDLPPASVASVDLKEAVIDAGKTLPTLPSVDFKWISDDGLMFTIGRWIPRPEASDDEVPSFVLNLRKFNRGDLEVTKGFAKLISRLSRRHHLLAPCDTVCNVPASKSESTETPITVLSHMVAEMAAIRDGTGWLVRHKTVLPAGFLNIGTNEGKHLDSVRVAHNDLVEGRTILLLDDFIDTGSTMRACRHLLYAVGAKRVLCLALALREHAPL